jgi:chromosomal replication initiator protein
LSKNQLATKEIKQRLVKAIQSRLSAFNYQSWFNAANWDLSSHKKIYLSVPNKFIRDWIFDNYAEIIKFEYFKITGNEADLVINTSEVKDKDSDAKANPEIKKPAAVKNIVSPSKPSFNPKYQFDDFVVGNSNQFVHAACRAACLNPGKNYNPLFIYGGVGLGKTHLIHAMGHELSYKHPDWNIHIISAEQFTNEVINAIRYDKTTQFRKKYREDCDVLLIDDIQFIAGKERTMEEFFHTFNALYEKGCQVVLTSDTIPQEIPNLEERLRSRFNCGLLADIQTPDFETRCAILAKKAELEKIKLPTEVCHLIASRVQSNVRDLEGSLIRIQAFASLASIPITLSLANEVLDKISPKTKTNITIEDIQKSVADYFKLEMSELKSSRRHKRVSYPRQIAMYLCKEHLEASYPEIGQKFGGKDHSTVIHAYQKIKKEISSNNSLENQIKKIQNIWQD